MALRVDDLPIRVHDDQVAFPWFLTVDPKANDYIDRIAAYRTFLTLLCQTALNKTRVNAKEREQSQVCHAGLAHLAGHGRRRIQNSEKSVAPQSKR